MRISYPLSVAIACLAFPILVTSCANEASGADSLSDSFDGLVRIKASGDSVTLSDNLVSVFTYNFYISRHEVTRGEYAERMGGAPDSGMEKRPVTDVTFFDAVLYANKFSKSAKLDTVYSYKSIATDADGRAVLLKNLTTDFSANGFRLPTEAEWTYAADKGWNPSENAWTSENSGYDSHDVCTRGTNGFDLCDMAGNAMEWTNDWLSDLSDTTLLDYAGGESANSLGESVVKGGSFRNAAANIKLENRGDIYTVTPSMYANYVGFRLVRGSIGDPKFAAVDGQEKSWKVTVEATSDALRMLLGTYRAKLAFRDDATGNIGFVNFLSSSPSAVEIQDTIDSYHPAISPDGSKVAFCTKPEGISGMSALYVRDLNAAGTNLVKLDVESAAIPRWRIAGADTEIVYVTSAGNNLSVTDWKSGSTWSVPFADGKFGTPVKLFDGTYNGGVSPDGNLAVTGARLLRANVGGKEETWYSGEQACNASLSDSTKRTLFLDFGGAAGQAFAGTSYNAHERILVADSTGNLIETLPAPAGYAFDHTEWVQNANNYAVSTLTNSDGAHTKIVFVNLSDSSVTELASGEELWHPDLWVGESTSADTELDLDSAGVYLFEGDEYVFQLLRTKMEIFWENADSIEIACVGSSHVEDGIDPTLLSADFKAVNLGHPGNTLAFSKYIAENYVLNHTRNLKAIVVALDLGIWQNIKISYFEQFLKYPGVIYDQNHQFWKSGIPEGFVSYVEQSFANEDIQNIYKPTLGYQPCLQANGWGAVPEVETDSLWATNDPSIVPYQMQQLSEFIEYAESKNIEVVGIVFPQSPKYKETGSFGRYGPQRSVAIKMIAQLDSLQTKYKNFHLMDENKMGDHDYTDAMASNMDHLSSLGAVQMTSRLDSLLRTLK